MSTDKQPIFSPSQTNNFSFCPRYWALDQAGWVTRLVEYSELCAVLGSGVAVGLGYYNEMLQAGVEFTVDEAVAFGIRDTEKALIKINTDGRSIESLKDREFVDFLPKRVDKAVKLYHKNNPYIGCKIIAVEHTYPDHGYCRPDLLIETPQSDLVVVDYKVKVKLPRQWRQKELDKYNDHWNMMHYAWATGATSYEICMIVLSPELRVERVPYAINPSYSEVWRQDAAGMWDHMQKMHNREAPMYGRTKHYNEYGDCKYINACTRYGLSTQQMAIEFIQIERRKPHV